MATATFLCLTSQAELGFTQLFNGKNLDGWVLQGQKGDGFGVKDGVLFCARGGGGKLLTEQEFSDFVLRFEFRLEAGSNNGLGIRAPMEGDAAYTGMELQILDNTHPKYAKLRPEQYHGSVYDLFAAKRGALKPVGEWNSQEVDIRGRKLKVTLNGQVIVDVDLNDAKDPKKLQRHPGLFREKGHIGFLGHNDFVEFRNIRIRELPVYYQDNEAPDGFQALFTGEDLSHWKGLVANPPKRAAMSEAELAEAQKKADEEARAHWKADRGVLVFDGKGKSLCTDKDYKNFEMWVDWKIHENGDSGVYLRGSPQVQIWDPFNGAEQNKVGSGGLFNNKKNPAVPLKVADRPIGEWNRFRIVMIEDRVHVFLNGETVVANTVLENYWERDKPIYPSGQIELQNHGNKLYFKNIFIRELP